MSQYDQLDELIYARIKDGARTQLKIKHHAAVKLELGRLFFATGRSVFQILDGRLQSMRKRGLIRFGGTPAGWRIAE